MLAPITAYAYAGVRVCTRGRAGVDQVGDDDDDDDAGDHAGHRQTDRRVAETARTCRVRHRRAARYLCIIVQTTHSAPESTQRSHLAAARTHTPYETRYEMLFNVRSKVDISQLNLPLGTNN